MCIQVGEGWGTAQRKHWLNCRYPGKWRRRKLFILTGAKAGEGRREKLHGLCQVVGQPCFP